MEEGWSTKKHLTGRPIGKGPLGSHRRRRKDNIRMDTKEIFMNTWNLVNYVQDRDKCRALVKAALNHRFL